jgi:histone deacetylase complex regulatory component SIN3
MAFATRLYRLTADQKMIDGVKKYSSQFRSLSVDSQKMTAAYIVKLLQARIDAANAVSDAAAVFAAAVKKERGERAKAKTILSSFSRIVVEMFRQSPDTLADFGLKAPKARKQTVQGKADAQAKSKATRTARNTPGAKQEAPLVVPLEKSNGAMNGAALPKQPTA